MTQFLRTLYIDIKMQSRIPVASFFALLFPVLMLVVFTVSYENPGIGKEYHFVDKYILIAVGLGTLPTCLLSFASWIGEAVNDGTYKRLALFGVNMKQVFCATILTHLFLILATIGINLLTAVLFFNASLPDPLHLTSYLLSILYALLVCLLIALLIAFIAPNFKSIMPISMATMFVLFIVCGAFVPYENLPHFLKTIASYIPLKYMMQDFFDIYRGETYFSNTFLLVNTAWLFTVSILLLIIYRCRGRKSLA